MSIEPLVSRDYLVVLSLRSRIRRPTPTASIARATVMSRNCMTGMSNFHLNKIKSINLVSKYYGKNLVSTTLNSKILPRALTTR
jgi:hypothetical protein